MGSYVCHVLYVLKRRNLRVSTFASLKKGLNYTIRDILSILKAGIGQSGEILGFWRPELASPAKFWDFRGLNRPNDSIRAIFGESNTGLNFSGKKLPILGFFCPYIFTDFQENSARPPVVFSGVLVNLGERGVSGIRRATWAIYTHRIFGQILENWWSPTTR